MPLPLFQILLCFLVWSACIEAQAAANQRGNGLPNTRTRGQNGPSSTTSAFRRTTTRQVPKGTSSPLACPRAGSIGPRAPARNGAASSSSQCMQRLERPDVAGLDGGFPYHLKINREAYYNDFMALEGKLVLNKPVIEAFPNWQSLLEVACGAFDEILPFLRRHVLDDNDRLLGSIGASDNPTPNRSYEKDRPWKQPGIATVFEVGNEIWIGNSITYRGENDRTELDWTRGLRNADATQALTDLYQACKATTYGGQSHRLDGRCGEFNVIRQYLAEKGSLPPVSPDTSRPRMITCGKTSKGIQYLTACGSTTAGSGEQGCYQWAQHNNIDTPDVYSMERKIQPIDWQAILSN